MILVAEISNGIGSLSSMLDGLEFTPAGLVLGGIYALCLLAGLAIDIVMGVRLLAARRNADHPACVPGTGSVNWVRCVKRLQDRAWTWREAALILIVLLVAQLAAQGVRWIIVAWGGAPLDSDMLAALCQGLGLHGVGLAALVWSIRRRRVSWERAFGINWWDAIRRTGQGMIWCLAILPLIMVASLIYQIILLYFGYPRSIQNVVLFFLEPQAMGVQVFMLILALVIAPMTEEALFRGVALPLLARTAGVIPAIMITSACFALIHFHVPSIASLFVLAAGLAVAYIVTESLWVSIVTHALFNGMNIGLILLATAR